jgi:hypothetical protein
MRLALSKSVIRPFEATDAAAIAKHSDNRNVWINLNDSFPHPFTIEAAGTFLEKARRKAGSRSRLIRRLLVGFTLQSSRLLKIIPL